MIFNRGVLKENGWADDGPEDDELKHTTGLFRATLQDAVTYGGEATRWALSSLDLVGDREHVSVDTKVHMLMKGMCPAIPGWHTDGVPRSMDHRSLSPSGAAIPNLKRQEGEKSPRYHVLVTASPPAFLEDRDVQVASAFGPDLYARVNREIERSADVWNYHVLDVNRWHEFDWWELHRGEPAAENGWRFLIRVTESDYLPAKTDLREVLRTQQQAYTTEDFGW